MPSLALRNVAMSFQQRYREPLLSALFVSALVAALFHNGELTEAMSLSLAFLLVWLGIVLFRTYSRGIVVPITLLTATLTLFCLWVGLTVFWSRVPYVSAINFWWLTACGLVFWLVTWSENRQRIITQAFRGTVAVAVTLVVIASYQRIVEGGDPRALFYNHNAFAAFLALTSFPLLGWLLLDYRVGGFRPGWIAGAMAVGLLQFGIALTGGRAVTFSFFVVFSTLYIVVRRSVAGRGVVILLAMLIVAHVAAGLATHGQVTERIATITSDAVSMDARWLIWDASWRLLQNSPWYGIGVGTYWLAFPTFRLPADTSAGFYAHNDYLQLWIEAGWPGLVLVLAVLGAVLFQFVRVLRQKSCTDENRVTLAAAFCGLLVVAMHTFVDFDLYALPIQLLLGLVLAQFHAGYMETGLPVRVWRFRPDANVGKRAFGVMVVSLLMFPAAYFASLGFNAYSVRVAQSLASQGRWVEADQWMRRAERLLPSSDRPLVIHADLLRQAIDGLPPQAEDDQRELFSQTRDMLDRAERLNPLRPLIFLTRGLLYRNNARLTGDTWFAESERAFEHALQLDPRCHQARAALALMLQERGEDHTARTVLEAGANYWYFPDSTVIPYYTLLVSTRFAVGDVVGAQEVAHRIADIRSRYGVKTASPGA